MFLGEGCQLSIDSIQFGAFLDGSHNNKISCVGPVFQSHSLLSLWYISKYFKTNNIYIYI